MIIVIVIVLLFFVVTTTIIILKNAISPKKIDGVPRLIKQGKTQAAIKLAKQVLTKNQQNYVAHYYLGKAYIADNKQELAIMEYRLVNDNALFGEEIKEEVFRKEYGNLLMKYNQKDEALKEFILMTKLNPKDPDNFFQAGLIYESMNRYDIALGYMQKCVAIDKKNARAHAEIGMMMYRTKKLAEARREIDLALKISPETYSSYYYLGKIHKEEKDLPAAIKNFEKAQRDPEFKLKAIVEHGTCYMMANRIDNAIPDFQRAIDLDKDGKEQEALYARYFLASCYENIRKIDKAIEQWEFIYKKNKGFRDVAAKLSEYKDLQSNDFMKDYLTSSPDEFVGICKNACEKALNMQIISADIKKWGAQVTGVDKKDEAWLAVRKQVIFIRFYREPEPLPESVIHETLDEMKTVNSVKGYIFSSSGFNGSAKQFAENRPVELFEKQKLEQLLTKAG